MLIRRSYRCTALALARQPGLMWILHIDVVMITLGWAIDRSFTPIPGSSVVNTITFGVVGRTCYAIGGGG